MEVRRRFMTHSLDKLDTPYEENIIVVASDEIYWKKQDGKRGIRICGLVRSSGRRCQAPAGKNTDHEGIGRCLAHDKGKEGSKNWIKLAADLAKGTKLADMLEKSEEHDVRVGEVYDEIRFQQALILWYVKHVMDRDPEPEFEKEDIKFLKELNIDMIRSKESAARIKGSMKLDALTVRQFVDQILTFLFTELRGKLEKEILMRLVRNMMEKVFAPMAATSMITGGMHSLTEIPKNLENLKMVKK